MTRRRVALAPRRFWTAADDARMRRDYPHQSTAVVAAALQRSVAATYGRADTLGLRKSAAYMASPEAYRWRRGQGGGEAFRFGPGHVPANKGLKRPGWAVGRMRETQFKAGVPSWRTAAIGATRMVDGYLYRKLTDTQGVPWTANWVLEHRRIWTAVHGPIPPGHVLVFKNGKPEDVGLDNLELIPRTDLMRRNSVHHLPEPLKGAVFALGSLTRAITMKEKHAREKEHQ